MKKTKSLKQLYKILLKSYIKRYSKEKYAHCICQTIHSIWREELISLKEDRFLIKHFLTQYYRAKKIDAIILDKENVGNDFWFTPGEYSKREKLLKIIIKSL